mgnify:CR=1 FL=1
MLNASSARIHITKNMTMRWKTVGIIALFNAVHLKMFVDIVAMSSCEKRVRFRRFWNYLKKKRLIINTSTGKSFSEALIHVSTNSQYDKRLFIEVRVQYMKIPSSEHIGLCFDIQNNLCIQHVLSLEFSFTEIVIQWIICRHIVG